MAKMTKAMLKQRVAELEAGGYALTPEGNLVPDKKLTFILNLQAELARKGNSVAKSVVGIKLLELYRDSSFSFESFEAVFEYNQKSAQLEDPGASFESLGIDGVFLASVKGSDLDLAMLKDSLACELMNWLDLFVLEKAEHLGLKEGSLLRVKYDKSKVNNLLAELKTKPLKGYSIWDSFFSVTSPTNTSTTD